MGGQATLGGINSTSHITSSGNISASGDLFLHGGDIDLKNAGAQSNIKFYCETNNQHYTKLQAAAHADYSGNVTTTLPTYDFTFKEPFFNANVTASGDISSSGNIILGNSKKLTFDNNLSGIYLDSPTTNQLDFHVNNSAIITLTNNIVSTAKGITVNTGNVSGSATSTGSFGSLMIGGGHFTSASLAAGGSGGGGGSADNLGNHTATQVLDLDGNSIKDALHITASGNITGSSVTTASFGHLIIGGSSYLGNPNTLVGIDESVATAADKIPIWDESDDLWKYITIDNLQDEIDTTGGGGGGGGISFDGSTEGGVTTYKDADEVTVQTKLTFDGGTLFVGEDGGTYVSASTSGQLEISGSGTANLNVDGHISATHITASSNIRGNILYQTSSITATGNAQGDIVKFANTTTVAGAIYAYTGSGWILAGSGSTNHGSASLGFAIGTNSTTDGMLLRGIANVGYDPGGKNGCALYLEGAGSASHVVPTATGAISRVVGWNYGSDTIYFNPDNTWIKIS